MKDFKARRWHGHLSWTRIFSFFSPALSLNSILYVENACWWSPIFNHWEKFPSRTECAGSLWPISTSPEGSSCCTQCTRTVWFYKDLKMSMGGFQTTVWTSLRTPMHLYFGLHSLFIWTKILQKTHCYKQSYLALLLLLLKVLFSFLSLISRVHWGRDWFCIHKCSLRITLCT